MSLRICQVLAVLILVLIAPEAMAACLPDPPMDDDPVVCDGTDSTGYDGSGATGLTITTDGAAILDESDPGLDSAILISDDGTVTIGAAAQIIVTEDAGFGIRGNNDNFIDNQGTITINGADGRGISINENTTGVLPNGAVNSFEIFAIGDRSIALETGLNSGVATTGRIDVIGIESRGISAADRTDFGIASNISNTGILNVSGDDAFGIKAGDGWIQGEIVGELEPSEPGIRNLFGGTINVSGARAFGIFAGDETNLGNNNNSFVTNAGMIDVSGFDAIGVSLGGNDLLTPFDFRGTTPLSVTSFENPGEIIGGVDAGPLVEFRTFVAGMENQIRNDTTGRIIADPNILGLANRGIAIRGSNGAEFVINFGEIQGDIEFNAGDDRYVHTPGATLSGSLLGGDGDDRVINFGEIQGDIEFNAGDDRYVHTPGATLSGSLRGGGGDDRVILILNNGTLETFDVSPLVDFETLEVGGGATGWALSNAAGYTGLTEIPALGRLQVPTPISLGGALTVVPTGTLEITLEGPTTPLNVQGFSTFEGTLVVNPGPGLVPRPTPYRLIETVGGRTGRFDFSGVSGTTSFELIYDASGVLTIYQVGLVAVAQGSTQRAIAQNLSDIDAAGGASGDLQNLIDEFDTSTGILANVYEALSPEAYDVQTTIVVEGGRRIANLLFDRPRECQVGELDPWRRADTPLPCHARNWSPWLAAIGGFRSREKFSDHPKYDSSMGGLVFGIDARPIAGLDLTFAISSQRGTVDVAGAGESTLTLTDLSGQAAWSEGALRVQGVLSWGHGFHDDRRQIHAAETTTPLDSRAFTDHDSDRITVAAEVGLLFDVGPIKIEPIGGLDWAWVYQRAIHEKGAGGFGIRIASRDDDIGSINGGLRLSTIYRHSRYIANQLEWMDGIWRPVIDVRWRQVVAGNERDIDARFQGSPDAVPDFTTTGREDNGGFELAAGLSFMPRHANRLQIDLRYEAFLSSHTVEQNLVARVNIGF